ncbi:MAG: PfkB family carbohydrate kinase [Micrococcales bacterium]|nr:PfkB family carbohydrate kinase [Micrococcales bacterium]
MGSVVCVGLTTLDVVQVVDRVPGPDEKVVAHDGWTAFGGPAANAAATCAALGVEVRLVTALGTGAVAGLVRAGLVDAGVEMVDLAPDAAGLLPVSAVLVTGSSRAVVSRNAGAAPDLSVAAADVLAAGTGDVVLVDGHHLGAATVLATRSAGATVLADGGSWKPGLEGLLAHVDVAVLSADFHLPMHDGPGTCGPARGGADLLAAVAALGPAVVAQTRGAGAVRVRTADGAVSQIDPPPVPVVDTLGAGDVLHGAVAAALARGADPLAAVEAGVTVASRSVQFRGALGWARDGR